MRLPELVIAVDHLIDTGNQLPVGLVQLTTLRQLRLPIRPHWLITPQALRHALSNTPSHRLHVARLPTELVARWHQLSEHQDHQSTWEVQLHAPATSPPPTTITGNVAVLDQIRQLWQLALAQGNHPDSVWISVAHAPSRTVFGKLLFRSQRALHQKAVLITAASQDQPEQIYQLDRRTRQLLVRPRGPALLTDAQCLALLDATEPLSRQTLQPIQISWTMVTPDQWWIDSWQEKAQPETDIDLIQHKSSGRRSTTTLASVGLLTNLNQEHSSPDGIFLRSEHSLLSLTPYPVRAVQDSKKQAVLRRQLSTWLNQLSPQNSQLPIWYRLADPHLLSQGQNHHHLAEPTSRINLTQVGQLWQTQLASLGGAKLSQLPSIVIPAVKSSSQLQPIVTQLKAVLDGHRNPIWWQLETPLAIQEVLKSPERAIVDGLVLDVGQVINGLLGFESHQTVLASELVAVASAQIDNLITQITQVTGQLPLGVLIPRWLPQLISPVLQHQLAWVAIHPTLLSRAEQVIINRDRTALYGTH